jgi:ACS family glucarate transporter-like MFS transporter
MQDPERPSRARYWVVVFVSALAVILYVDRVCISKAQSTIQAEFHLSDTQFGWVFSAFTFAYAIFEIPAGWLGDRFGPRKVLMRIVLWWSFFTAATGWTMGFISLIVTRFLFGAGEAGCFPNTAKAYSIWLPSEERNWAQSFLWISARWGGAFTPFLVYQVLQVMNWRWAFSLFGTAGCVWALLFHRWFRDNPRIHPGVNAAERQMLAANLRHTDPHGDVPWRRFLASRTTWFLWIQYFCFSWVWYFYISWLPRFLDDRFKGQMSPAITSLLTGLPLFLGGLGSFTCGFAAAGAARTFGSVARARRILAGGGFLLAAGTLLLTLQSNRAAVVLGLLGVSCFLADFVIPVSWAACIDVGGKFSGTYSGSMNMMGNLGGAAATAVIGHLLDLTHKNWNVVFYLAAGVFVAGALCWFFIDPVTPMDDPEPPERRPLPA